MARDKDIHAVTALADRCCYIHGEEVARVEVAVDRSKVDVVGIHMIGMLPADLADGLIGSPSDTLGSGADHIMFAVGFVPDRNDGHAEGGGFRAGLQLSTGLVGEAVANPPRKFPEL